MKQYFYLIGTEKEGPITLDELKQKEINPKTLIWYEGLDDWKEAEYIDELREFFELRPPPINVENKGISLSNENNNLDDIKPVKIMTNTIELKKASEGWIIGGFIFAILGGFLGIIMGLNYAFGNYKRETKTIGWVMAILGFISAVIWKS